MRLINKRALLAISSIIALAPVATAEANTTTCEKAYTVRASVVKKHGSRAPGRNICRFGVRSIYNSDWERPAKYAEKVRYLGAMNALLNPAPAYLKKYASDPSLPPAGTLTPHYKPTGLASCIVAHESGGNPQARNGQYTGIAQWSAEAWARHGGHRFAGSPTGASYEQQLQVLSNGLQKYGCRDWCPYDGC